MKMQMRFMAGCLLAGAAVAAQNPGPSPAPVPPVPPAPPVSNYGTLDPDFMREFTAEMKEFGLSASMENLRVNADAIREQADQARRSAEMFAQMNTGYGSMGRIFGNSNSTSPDRLYQKGQNALDGRRYQEAVDAFSQAYGKGGARAEASLYWCAYAQYKLGKRDDALASIANLRKSFPNSRWLEDAKALELEVKQSSGAAVSPEAQSDEDLKLLALNGLMMNDPDRAIPALEGLLKGAQSPRMKEQVLFVLAGSSSPKAQQLLEQVVKGGANPDLQVKAIQYIASSRRRGADGQRVVSPTAGPLLMDVYNGSQDVTVKRAVLNALSSMKDRERVRQIVDSEKTASMRAEAIQRLMSFKDSAMADSFVKYYASTQSDKEIKRSIVGWWAGQDAVKQMVQAARGEKDPEMVRYIVTRLASMKSPEATDYLMEVVKK